MKEYFVITFIDGEQTNRVMSEHELAHLWQDDEDAGYIDVLLAYRFNAETSKMEQVNVYEVATNYLKGEREVQQEYEDYCETVNEYGYDYYDNPDNLEMGVDPYAGCYTDDC